MPDGTQTYRIGLPTRRGRSPDFLLSTDVRTRWTVPANVATGPLRPRGVHVPPDRRQLRVLPLITQQLRPAGESLRPAPPAADPRR